MENPVYHFLERREVRRYILSSPLARLERADELEDRLPFPIKSFATAFALTGLIERLVDLPPTVIEISIGGVGLTAAGVAGYNYFGARHHRAMAHRIQLDLENRREAEQ